ncbi:hypothetical protein BXY70_1306 [Roseovarius halotolerans]|uniref:Uncharacterized protein n=1 Tax=Roseovarius halotolerans TaxID=505353 RepID=A0A1X6Y5Q3_9RHOB|nr:hypothetical protein [Roseovarius halotolerans]RKT35273.1 hypothetical protein BXY70_1306 [Roseovarius halotolerans]SLN11336.1 hypothetical protein ROH8110_00090 [Roseovarius halotolerans]
MITLSQQLDAIADLAKHDPDIDRICVVPGGIEIEMSRDLGEWQGLEISFRISWIDLQTFGVDVLTMIEYERGKLDDSQKLYQEGTEIPDGLPQVAYWD